MGMLTSKKDHVSLEFKNYLFLLNKYNAINKKKFTLLNEIGSAIVLKSVGSAL
jgi:hypothetical protein